MLNLHQNVQSGSHLGLFDFRRRAGRGGLYILLLSVGFEGMQLSTEKPGEDERRWLSSFADTENKRSYSGLVGDRSRKESKINHFSLSFIHGLSGTCSQQTKLAWQSPVDNIGPNNIFSMRYQEEQTVPGTFNYNYFIQPRTSIETWRPVVQRKCDLLFAGRPELCTPHHLR